MTQNNTTDGDQHFFANDGSDWRSTAGPVSSKEAREVDAQQDEQGDGPEASNELKLGWSVVEGSEKSVNPQHEDKSEDDESQE